MSIPHRPQETYKPLHEDREFWVEMEALVYHKQHGGTDESFLASLGITAADTEKDTPQDKGS